MKKKILILITTSVIIVIFAVIAGIILFGKNAPGQRVIYTPLVSGRIGTHINITDNVFKDRKLTKDEEKELNDCLEQADKMLKEDILVVGWCRMSVNNRLLFNAYQYVDGVVVPDVTYRLTDDRGMCVEKTADIPPVSSLDTADMIDPEELFPVVDGLALQHESELHMEQDNKIYVIYNPEYDTIKDELYYYFRINEYSRIRIDAKTGDILEEHYFNGEFID